MHIYRAEIKKKRNRSASAPGYRGMKHLDQQTCKNALTTFCDNYIELSDNFFNLSAKNMKKEKSETARQNNPIVEQYTIFCLIPVRDATNGRGYIN